MNLIKTLSIHLLLLFPSHSTPLPQQTPNKLTIYLSTDNLYRLYLNGESLSTSYSPHQSSTSQPITQINTELEGNGPWILSIHAHKQTRQSIAGLFASVWLNDEVFSNTGDKDMKWQVSNATSSPSWKTKSVVRQGGWRRDWHHDCPRFEDLVWGKVVKGFRNVVHLDRVKAIWYPSCGNPSMDFYVRLLITLPVQILTDDDDDDDIHVQSKKLLILNDEYSYSPYPLFPYSPYSPSAFQFGYTDFSGFNLFRIGHLEKFIGRSYYDRTREDWYRILPQNCGIGKVGSEEGFLLMAPGLDDYNPVIKFIPPMQGTYEVEIVFKPFVDPHQLQPGPTTILSIHHSSTLLLELELSGASTEIIYRKFQYPGTSPLEFIASKGLEGVKAYEPAALYINIKKITIYYFVYPL